MKYSPFDLGPGANDCQLTPGVRWRSCPKRGIGGAHDRPPRSSATRSRACHAAVRPCRSTDGKAVAIPASARASRFLPLRFGALVFVPLWSATTDGPCLCLASRIAPHMPNLDFRDARKPSVSTPMADGTKLQPRIDQPPHFCSWRRQHERENEALLCRFPPPLPRLSAQSREPWSSQGLQ